MLDPIQTYEGMRRSFQWEFPPDYNMGWDVCDKWADTQPDRVAIIDLTSEERSDVSYSELQSLANKLGNQLLRLGIQRGDRVGVLRTQSVWTAAAHIAIWKIGAISIPLFTLFGEEALETRLSDSGAGAIITDAEQNSKHAKIFSKLPDLRDVIVPEQLNLDELSSSLSIAKTDSETPGLIIYTSGTTGAPKGALHAHRVLRGHLPGVELSHNLLPQDGDVLWTPADWAWIGGLLDVLMPGLCHGIPVVAARLEKFDGSECSRVIQTAGIRNVFFPPTALRMLKAEGVSIPGLRTVACGGEPLGAEMIDWGKRALGLTINEFYGQTECNMVVSSCSSLFEPNPGCIGKPVPGHEVAVIDRERNKTNLEGDIAVRRGTPVMMLEYWNNRDATREKFRGDWLLTGDKGVMDGEFIKFIGRDDDVITSAGYRIGPAEIEDCLLRHEAVASVGVVGKPDSQRTEIVKAFVVLKDGYRPRIELVTSMQEFVKTRLAAHEYPREIEFVSSLPMTVTGKIIRKELKARAIAELENA